MKRFNVRSAAAFVGMMSVATIAIVGCDDDQKGTIGANQNRVQTAPASDTAGAALPAGLALTEAPAGAKEVATLKKEAKAGDEVVVRGRVGGSQSPFVDGRASFQLVDASLKACGEANPDDKCTTPWDYCCDDPKEVAAHSASVQVVGADGKPLRAGLSGFAGLKPLSEVTVKGTVSKAGEAGLLVINATGLHVKG